MTRNNTSQLFSLKFKYAKLQRQFSLKNYFSKFIVMYLLSDTIPLLSDSLLWMEESKKLGHQSCPTKLSELLKVRSRGNKPIDYLLILPGDKSVINPVDNLHAQLKPCFLPLSLSMIHRKWRIGITPPI